MFNHKMNILNNLRKEIHSLSNPQKAKIYRRFFKTGKGEYGEGDIFLGITVPQSRKIAKKYADLKFNEITALLKSKINEERVIALLILVNNYQKNEEKRKNIFDFYLKSTKYINNWDLVDLTADKILGHYISNKTKDILCKLSKSENLWERRIAIVSTFHFIKNNQFDETLKISKLLLKDKHDLIHKAVGWMLREVGKRSQSTLKTFLRAHYKKMPRTMLRYAIERFSPEERKAYLFGTI